MFSRMADEHPWYTELREEWKPERVKLLMVAESAPDDHGDPTRRRCFYSARIGADNLFRSVVEAMYEVTAADLAARGKRPWLERLRDDGFFLIDLAAEPVNAMGSTARRQVLRAAVPGCVERAVALDPESAIIVKADVYGMLAEPMRAAGIRVPQEGPIPFPLGNWREQFVESFNRARSV